VYNHPTSNFGPVDLLALFAPGTALHTGKLLYPPGSYQSYSSTNFILLGLLLAAQANGPTSDVEAYEQDGIFAGLKPGFALPSFAVRGPPRNYTRVRGFDRTPCKDIIYRFRPPKPTQLPNPIHNAGRCTWAHSP